MTGVNAGLAAAIKKARGGVEDVQGRCVFSAFLSPLTQHRATADTSSFHRSMMASFGAGTCFQLVSTLGAPAVRPCLPPTSLSRRPSSPNTSHNGSTLALPPLQSTPPPGHPPSARHAGRPHGPGRHHRRCLRPHPGRFLPGPTHFFSQTPNLSTPPPSSPTLTPPPTPPTPPPSRSSGTCSAGARRRAAPPRTSSTRTPAGCSWRWGSRRE